MKFTPTRVLFITKSNSENCIEIRWFFTILQTKLSWLRFYGSRCRVPCSNAAKTRKKFAGVPQTPEPISVVNGPKFIILLAHVEEVLLLNNFFPIVDICLRCDDTEMAIFALFLRPVFPASRMQHISDLHPKFALKPHHVWKHGRHPLCDRWH